MNPNTLVAVCGYAGDAHQIRNALPLLGHHECPVLVLSPNDSPITDVGPGGIFYRTGGKRAYIGQESLDRQRRHMEILLECPFEFFLMHDSDSVCLSPELPKYLYSETRTIWSNLVIDDIPGREWPKDFDWPHLAFQPPYFFSRTAVEEMLSVADKVVIDPVRPFIDFYMVQLAVLAGIPYKRFENCASCETVTPLGRRLMHELVRDKGVVFCHAIKTPDILHQIYEDSKAFKAGLTPS